MRLFISAGEPSGDLHGANLIRSLKQHHPGIDVVGFGGERMEAAGCHLLYPLCDLAVMWFARVLANAPTFLRLLSQADRYFRHHRPDGVVLIDYPGFHWWLARRAHFHRIPVFWFIPPQLWAWAGWRVRKMQRWVDHVLCVLPFEEDWYRRHGVQTQYVGHPYFDELSRQLLDDRFLRSVKRTGPIVGLLPGSRHQEIDRNLSTLVRSAARIHDQRPDVRFLAACYRQEQQQQVEAYLRHWRLPIEVHAGRTADIIHLADVCVAVSGSVGLELLWHGKPSVVLYRIRPLDLQVGNWFKTAPYISLVNLLAGRELFPEYLTDHCVAGPISNHVLRWLNDPDEWQETRQHLLELRRKVAVPGACARAAECILNVLEAGSSLPSRSVG